MSYFKLMDKLLFKKGSQYTRKEVGWILLPKTGRPPKGGVWDTGYVRVDDKLIIFMNIGVPGKTKHDFNNYYDDTNKTIVWYGKSKSHSGQPIFQKLISGEYTPYFFARWDNKNTYFTFLGIGKIVSYKDDTPILDANNNKVETIELKLTIEDSDHQESSDTDYTAAGIDSPVSNGTGIGISRNQGTQM